MARFYYSVHLQWNESTDFCRHPSLLRLIAFGLEEWGVHLCSLESTVTILTLRKGPFRVNTYICISPNLAASLFCSTHIAICLNGSIRVFIIVSLNQWGDTFFLMFLARIGFSYLRTLAGLLRFHPWSPPHPSCQPPVDIVFSRNHSFNCFHDHSTSFSVKKEGSTGARRKTTEEDLAPVSERRLNNLVSEFPVPEQLFFG